VVIGVAAAVVGGVLIVVMGDGALGAVVGDGALGAVVGDGAPAQPPAMVRTIRTGSALVPLMAVPPSVCRVKPGYVLQASV
jgi:hypothetical protein